MKIQADGLTDYVAKVFAAAGCSNAESRRIAENLIDANLTGHDSHGVIRVPRYLKWLGEEKLLPDRNLSVVSESDGLLILDGHFGFG
ncbi:MAG: Ldh family oxidoreductase, partial [Hyphomicrobiaceae bacterium]|nr:Ldh family oxidoreductase [Hyphomicrobiaceae bacterium]